MGAGFGFNTGMFGFRFIKVPPTHFVIHYSKGVLKRSGTGLAFWYFSPYATLVSIPVASTEGPFIFEEATGDFQTVTVQGSVTYQVSEPEKLAKLLDFTLRPAGDGYRTEDPEKLPQRVLNTVKVLAKAELQSRKLQDALQPVSGWGLCLVELQSRKLQDALQGSEAISAAVRAGLKGSAELQALGLTVIGFSILAIKPTPETARALEAETRESLLKRADDATNARRNAAVEAERMIRENELRTEEVVQQKQQELREQEMAGKIRMEEQNKALVALSAENARAESDAKAYGVKALFEALAGADPKLLQAVASSGMSPEQLISQAFQDLAGRADKIGQLNITPDLLQNLLHRE